jgi:hypothetical protein
MKLLLTEQPQTAAELCQAAGSIFTQCGFAVTQTENVLLALDTSVEPAHKIRFGCFDLLTAAQLTDLSASAAAADFTGALYLQADLPAEEYPVKSFTWPAFNEYFQKTWLENRLGRLNQWVQPLIHFTDAFSPLYDDLYGKLDEEGQQNIIFLAKEYGNLPLQCNHFMGVPFWLHYNMEDIERYPSVEAYLDSLERTAVQGVEAFCRGYGLDQPRSPE